MFSTTKLKITLLVLTIWIQSTTAFGVNAPILETNLSFYLFPGLVDSIYGEFGYNLKATYPIFGNEIIVFHLGIEQGYYYDILNGNGFYGADKGYSYEFDFNGLAGILIYPFKKRKYYIGLDLYAGYKLLGFKGSVDTQVYNGVQEYSNYSHHFSWGTHIKTGFMLNSWLGINLDLKIPLHGMTDFDYSGIIDGDIAGPDTKIYLGIGCIFIF